jgi:hypothetical protein
LTSAQESSNRARYFRRRSASFVEERWAREAANKIRPASESERLALQVAITCASCTRSNGSSVWSRYRTLGARAHLSGHRLPLVGFHRLHDRSVDRSGWRMCVPDRQPAWLGGSTLRLGFHKQRMPIECWAHRATQLPSVIGQIHSKLEHERMTGFGQWSSNAECLLVGLLTRCCRYGRFSLLVARGGR